jgi:DNA polymerase-3 subunit chi
MECAVNFYKLLEKGDLISTIYLVCNKIMESGGKVVIYLENEKEMTELDDKLWTASQSEFMPHLTANSPEFEEFKEEVPILLTTNMVNEIEAENLIILKPMRNFEAFKAFEKSFFLFAGSIEDELLNARAFWKEVSAMKPAFTCKFYEQSRERKWELKA